ncbi:chemotaxis protein CheD [Paenalkalicoccus suaedae]|uniref:Probable chemoreceptor glutamine deamidase CheD n=1 Tax=Paenalkalicoccus suaedae TaxID=2592382 RepID=A0A859FFM8_9BACI|nr:chemotaxis protein CheD [Paenalkalicoccus suaedae]QKS71414.1 chemotaxis protein CheD [Paenalkalicoccus suaedae]
MTTIIKVGMADLKLASAPDMLRTSGLGSCIGVIIYDERIRLAGMAHIMLPNSSLARKESMNLAKYADTAVEEVLRLLLDKGASKFRLKAKMAGGAQMFTFKTSNEAMRIGPRNAEAVKEHLTRLQIPIVFEDTGGSSGRTIEFDVNSQVLEIRTVNKGVLHA